MRMFSVLLTCMGIVLGNANFGNAQDYTVRLINSFGNNSREGRLEILYSGTWGTVCDDEFTNASARVACARLGFGYIGTAIGNRHGAGTGQTWLDNVICIGVETGIQNCDHNAWGVHNCGHGEDVSISCGPTVCEKMLTGPNGTISSPNYPNVYSDNIDCYSYISLSSRHSVTITFLTFNTESCCDWVTISCSSGNAFTIRYSGSQIPAVLTILLCYHVTVNFRTDGSATSTGFSLSYRITSVCDNRYFSGLSGTISSPNYPIVLSSKLDCYSYLSASSEQTVTITFVAFHTQGISDWVAISCESGNAFTTLPFWGSKIPAVLTISSCNLVKVYFHLDGRSTCRGFSLKYNITSACADRHLSGLTGTISSSNFPNAYDNNLDCSSFISVPSGQTVFITFLAFYTQSNKDWVKITCASGKIFATPRYSGSEFPPVLSISSCSSVAVLFHTDSSVTYTGFSLVYKITSNTTAIGGFATRPSNAFPLSDNDSHVIFNCTTVSGYLPWWTINDRSSSNYTITNSTCGVIASAAYSYWFTTETSGRGSCNLIVTAPANRRYLLAGSFVCIDSTLSSARAIMVPINLKLRSTKRTNTLAEVTDIIRDEEIRISCNSSFTDHSSSPSLDFTYFLYSGGPFVRMCITRTYWTSEGSVVSSSGISSASSNVLVKAPKDGLIPMYTCNIAFYFFSNISDAAANSTMEISISTKPLEVLYWPTEDSMLIIGDDNGQIIRTPASLFCSVAANPPATYSWIDERNGNITNGPRIIIQHGGKYTCNASNIIRGQYYQTSKSANLEVLEDEKPQLLVLILGVPLGVAVITTIALLVILLSRKCCQKERNIDVGDDLYGNEHELRQRVGVCNAYAEDPGDAVNVADSENEDDDDNIYENYADEK